MAASLRPRFLAMSLSTAFNSVFVGVAQDVVVVGPVLREIQLRFLEDGDEVGKAFHLGRAFAEFVGIVKIRKVGAGKPRIVIDEGLDHLDIDLVADVTVALKGDHVLEARPLRNRYRRSKVIGVAVFIGDILDEQHEQDIVLVLAGIHAAAQLVA